MDAPAPILVLLTEISDNISGAYDSSLLATQTAKVLSLATNQSESAGAAVLGVSSTVGQVPTFLMQVVREEH